MIEKPLNRILEERKSLIEFKARNPRFQFRFTLPILEFRYISTPGLIKKREGISLWNEWIVPVLISQRYPVESPFARLIAVGCKGIPYHPNVLPHEPWVLCYGTHSPVLMLDNLARRIEQMIILNPDFISTEESNSLNPDACRFVRRLIKEKATPLRLGISLPNWCTTKPEQVNHG
jgi:hypothetical protein